LVTIRSPSWTSCTPRMMGYPSRTVHCVNRPELSGICSRSILESSEKWYGHHVCPTWIQSSIYGTWWRGPFRPKILHIQIPRSYGQLSRWHSAKSLQRSSIHTWNWCHVKLLHFARLEGVLHNTGYLFHEFWHFSVFLDCHRAVGLYNETQMASHAVLKMSE
jgi:hypothetical protein